MKKTKLALITGAGRGIGLAIAHRLASTYRLALTTKTESSAAKLRKIFPHSMIYVADLTRTERTYGVVQQIKNNSRRLDVLINNAGVYFGNKIEKTTDYQLEEMYALHIRTPFILIRELLSLLKASSQKQIINISSAANFARLPTEAAYTATKAGLSALDDVLQRELQKYGIRVSTIHPWSVNTKNFSDGEYMLQPENVADIIEFILSRNKNFQILNVEASGVRDWRGSWPPWVKEEKG